MYVSPADYCEGYRRLGSLQNIADSFAKRGLKLRPNLGESNELVLQLVDDEVDTETVISLETEGKLAS
jgi:hypothetical protein